MIDAPDLNLEKSEEAIPQSFNVRKDALPELAQSLLSAKSAARTIKGAMEALAPLAAMGTRSVLLAIAEESGGLEQRIGEIYNDIALNAFS